MWIRSLGQEDPLEEGMATLSSTLAWRIPMGRGTQQMTVHEVTKSQTQLKQLSTHTVQHKRSWHTSGKIPNTADFDITIFSEIELLYETTF